MRLMYRTMTLLLALTLVLGGASAAVARDATPESGTPASGTPAAGSGPSIGTPVTIIDADTGDDVAKITVDKVTDPFEDYDKYSAPDRGSRVVAVDYTIKNLVKNDSFDSPTYDLSVSTVNGLLLGFAYVSPAEGADVTPLSTDDIKGGESTSGTLFYVLPEDLKIAGIYYTAYGHLTNLANIDAAASPAVGDEVTVVNTDGDDYARVKIDKYIEPFEDYDRYSAPESGQHDVAVTVSLTNLLKNDGIDFGPSDFTLQTSDGLLYSTSYVTPSDESKNTPLENDRVGGGDSASGTIFFTVPDDIEVTGVYYQPDFGIMANIGNPSA